MRKIRKITNITLIFMIIGAVILQSAYAGHELCLRVPIGISEARMENAEDSYARGREYGNVELRKLIRHDMGNYERIFSWAIVDITKGHAHSRKFYSAKKKIIAYLDKIKNILESDSNVNWEADFRNVYNEFADNIDELVKILCKEMYEKNTAHFKYCVEAMKLSLKSFIGNDEIKDVDLENLFKIVGAMEAADFFIKDRKIVFKSQETAKHIIGREGELYRVFLNLVRNSVEAIRRSIDAEYLKAAKERTIEPNAEDFKGKGIININIYSDKGYSVIEISDNGPGMPEEALDAFKTRTVYSSKGEQGGRGIKAARNIIERNGGTIDVKSESGKGTTFIIKFPLASKQIDENLLYEKALLEEFETIIQKMVKFYRDTVLPVLSKQESFWATYLEAEHFVTRELHAALFDSSFQIGEYFEKEININKLIQALKEAKKEISVHLEIAKFFIDKNGILIHAKLRLKTSNNEGIRELGRLIEKDEDFREQYRSVIEEYYNYAKEQLERIDEIIAYFESKATSITQNDVINVMNSLKAASTAN